MGFRVKVRVLESLDLVARVFIRVWELVMLGFWVNEFRYLGL